MQWYLITKLLSQFLFNDYSLLKFIRYKIESDGLVEAKSQVDLATNTRHWWIPDLLAALR